MKEIKRYEVIAAAQSLLGTPWEHQGRNLFGCDCAGYVYLTGKKLKCDTTGVDSIVRYGRDPDKTMETILNANLVKKDRNQRLPGTILFFGFGKHGQHMGIITKRLNTFYHGYEDEGQVVETRLDKRWLNRIRGVYDFKGVVD